MQTAIKRAETELLKFALGYPEAYQDSPWGERVAKVKKKVFVFFHVPGFVDPLLQHGHGGAILGAKGRRHPSAPGQTVPGRRHEGETESDRGRARRASSGGSSEGDV